MLYKFWCVKTKDGGLDFFKTESAAVRALGDPSNEYPPDAYARETFSEHIDFITFKD